MVDGGRGAGPLGWPAQMRDELGRLPETAANIREASENLKQVSSQLIEVSAMLQRVVRAMEATGVAGGLDRIEQLGRDLDSIRRMMTPPRNLDQAARKLDEVADVVGGITGAVRRTWAGRAPTPVDDPTTPGSDEGSGAP